LALAKNYWAEKIGIKREDLVVVSIMPCLAKKYESKRKEFYKDGNPDIDYVLTTRELARLIKQFNLDLKDMPSETTTTRWANPRVLPSSSAPLVV
jgi:NAD(P)-dependent iron-only hydrogenase catalytic subunit